MASKNWKNAKGDEEKKAIDQLRDVILPKELTVTGIFETGHYLHDSEFLLVPIYCRTGVIRTGRRIATALPSGLTTLRWLSA